MPESSRSPFVGPIGGMTTLGTFSSATGPMSISERRASKQRSLDGIKRKRDADACIDDEFEEGGDDHLSLTLSAEAGKRQRTFGGHNTEKTAVFAMPQGGSSLDHRPIFRAPTIDEQRAWMTGGASSKRSSEETCSSGDSSEGDEMMVDVEASCMASQQERGDEHSPGSSSLWMGIAGDVELHRDVKGPSSAMSEYQFPSAMLRLEVSTPTGHPHPYAMSTDSSSVSFSSSSSPSPSAGFPWHNKRSQLGAAYFDLVR